MNEIKEYPEKMFDDIKHIDDEGNEYWLARELMPLLDYSKWQKFQNALELSKEACKNSNNNINDHFTGIGKMVSIGSNAKRKILDYKLSRYACYLIVQNGDSRKKAIALGQTYFAIQTRKQELSEKEYSSFTEDKKRIYRRNQARKGNYNLNKTAVSSGVKDLARFHNAGYKGLYHWKNEKKQQELLKIKITRECIFKNKDSMNRSF